MNDFERDYKLDQKIYKHQLKGNISPTLSKDIALEKYNEIQCSRRRRFGRAALSGALSGLMFAAGSIFYSHTETTTNSNNANYEISHSQSPSTDSVDNNSVANSPTTIEEIGSQEPTPIKPPVVCDPNLSAFC